VLRPADARGEETRRPRRARAGRAAEAVGLHLDASSGRALSKNRASTRRATHSGGHAVGPHVHRPAA
jgi:hypothetical protein